MKQLIFLHIGQCGIQISQSLWNLFCLEHQLSPDGQTTPSQQSSTTKPNPYLTSIFSQNSKGTKTPRAIHADTQPSVIDEVKHNQHRNLFNKNNMIAGKEDAANNYIRGHYTIGKYICDDVLEQVRKEVEKAESLQGFVFTHSVNGGTGSGLTGLMMERMTVQYGKKIRINTLVYPSAKYNDTIVAPYNTTLSGHNLLEYSDMTIPFTNQKLYSLCQNHLDIQMPTYSNINHLISQTISSLTTSLRFSPQQHNSMYNSPSLSLNQILTNLVPYPRIHFIGASFNQYGKVGYAYTRNSVQRVSQEVFKFQNFGIDLCGRNRRFMAACAFFRGDVVGCDAVAAMHKVKNNGSIKWVDWVPTGLKITTNNHKAHIQKTTGTELSPISANMLINNMAVDGIFGRINHKFDLMYAKRAFVHWYVGEGLDEGFFSQARQDMAALEKDYEDGSDFDPYWFEDQGEIDGGQRDVE